MDDHDTHQISDLKKMLQYEAEQECQTGPICS